MANCPYCNGTGKVRCRSCSGRKYHSRLTGCGDMEINTCIVCSGTGKMRCDACMGSGKVKDYRPDAGSFPSDDLLAGRWMSIDGSWLLFVPKGDQYSVEFGSAQGKAGSGTATLHGTEVSLQVKVLFVINYSTTLTLDGNTLRGKLQFGPIPIPMVFTHG